MPLPFLYPTAPQKRTEKPAKYKNYRSYKPYLRREFHTQCVYCLMPDALAGHFQYHIDHYRPRDPSDPRTDLYTNLYYACPRCNVLKGNYWPTAAEKKAGRYIPNPCEHTMTDHLKYKEVIVSGRSNTGTFTINKLRLNESVRADSRTYTLQAIQNIADGISEARDLIKDLKTDLANASSPTDRKSIQDELDKAQAQLDQLTTRLLQLKCR